MNTKLLEKKMENISPFELKNRLIDMADESLKKMVGGWAHLDFGIVLIPHI